MTNESDRNNDGVTGHSNDADARRPFDSARTLSLIAGIWVVSDLGYYFLLPLLGENSNYNEGPVAAAIYYLFWVGIAVITFWPNYAHLAPVHQMGHVRKPTDKHRRMVPRLRGLRRLRGLCGSRIAPVQLAAGLDPARTAASLSVVLPAEIHRNSVSATSCCRARAGIGGTGLEVSARYRSIAQCCLAPRTFCSHSAMCLGAMSHGFPCWRCCSGLRFPISFCVYRTALLIPMLRTGDIMQLQLSWRAQSHQVRSSIIGTGFLVGPRV